jgi:hypothetical protein
MYKKLFTFFLLSLILISTVSALGVSPGKTTAQFVPNGEFEGKITFKPDNPHPLKIETKGDFEIIVDKEMLYCSKEPCEVNYKVIMPESFDRPGRHRGAITAVEVPENAGSFINIVVRITSWIDIEVPYPGKYLETISISATNKEAGEEVPFQIQLINKGEEKINSAFAKIEVYDKDNVLVGSTMTNTVSDIENSQKVNLMALWDSKENVQGNYQAKITTFYDSESREEETDFKLGGLDIDLLKFSDSIEKDGLKEFFVETESIWSEEVTDLKAYIYIFNKTGEEILSFETLTRTISAWGKQNLTGYIDTDKLSEGNHSAKIVLSFAQQEKEYDEMLEIVLPKSEKKEFKLSYLITKTNLLVVMFVLVIIAVIILITALLPRKKEQ